jgi:hypothetical protein
MIVLAAWVGRSWPRIEGLLPDVRARNGAVLRCDDAGLAGIDR